MSQLIYAKKVACDWPGCSAVAETELPLKLADTTLPAGWLSLRPYISIYRVDGTPVGEVCELHSQCTIASLIALIGPEKK